MKFVSVQIRWEDMGESDAKICDENEANKKDNF